MKKSSVRKLLTACLAILFVAVLHKAYVVYTSLTVSFDIQTEKNINLEVKYASKAGQPFKVNVGTFCAIRPDDRHVTIALPITRMYKFRIDPGDNPGKIIISNVKVVSGKKEIRFDDFSKFEFRNAEHVLHDGGRLELVSNQHDPHFWFTPKFKFKGELRIDWFMLAILIIVSILLSYGISGICVKALSGCKIKEKRNALFCTFFCCLLIIPVVRMDKRDILPEENRKLAAFPRVFLSENRGFNYQFGKEFDAWMQDRFTARRSFIKRYDYALSFLNGYIQNKVAILYPDGWMFYKPWADRIYGIPAQSDLIKIKNNLTTLQSFCCENGIKLYVQICPIKEDIYFKYNRVARINKNERNTELVNFIRRETPSIQIIYSRKELADLSKINDNLYFKTDTHQTVEGAYHINKYLIEMIKKDFPWIELPNLEKDFLKKEEFKVRLNNQLGNGYIFWVLGLTDEKLLNTPYAYYELKNRESLSVTENHLLERVSTYSPAKGSAVLIGDSFTENQVVWLQFAFRNLIRFRANNSYENNEMCFERWSDRIKQISPDALIICVSASDSFTHLKNLYKD